MPSEGAQRLNRLLGLPDDWEPEHRDGEKRRAAGREVTRQKATERWEKFLQMILQGMTTAAALKELGVSEQALYHRCKRYPEFKTRYQYAQHRARSGQADRVWNGTSVDFATSFIPPPDDAAIDWPDEPYHYSFFQHAVSDALDSANEGDIVLVRVPPGGRKTTTLENWITYKIATNPEVRIGYISKTGDHATKSCARIKTLLHDDPTLAPELIGRFGPFHEHGQERRGRPWASKSFTVSAKEGSTRDYTFVAVGAGNQIYGSRFDIMILDDFQTNQNIEQTEKLLHQFRYEIMTRRPTGVTKEGRPRGIIVIIGTAVEAGDFYERLEDEFAGQPWFRVVSYPAVGSDGNSLDPECFPDQVIGQLRAQVGEHVWSTSYLQRPPSKQNPTFSKRDRERARKPKLLLGWGRVDDDGIKVDPGRPSDWGVAVGLDPNLGAGYTSITALGFSASRCRVLDNEERYGLSRTEDIIELLDEFAGRYRPDEVRIEINAFQRGLARDDRLMGNPAAGIVGLRQKHGFQVREHTTTGKSRDDSQIGIARMASTFIADAIDIPYGDDEARAKMDLLDAELASWRPKISGAKLKQDRVASLWFAWLVWQERLGHDLSRKRGLGFQTRGMSSPTPYAPVLAGPRGA